MKGATVMASATLTTGQAAARLKVDPSTVRRLADAGYLPAIRLTPRSPRRFRQEDVRRLLEQAGAAA
jgi:excisionase family DNA binding protein